VVCSRFSLFLLVLERITWGRVAGFSLDEIAVVLTPSGPSIDRPLLLEKAGQLEKKSGN
jgi:hypothetical protein